MGSLINAWEQEKKRRNNTAETRTGSGLSAEWERHQQDRMKQSMAQLDRDMQTFQKQSNVRKSYWDGNDQSLRNQATSINQRISSLEKQAQRYGVDDKQMLSALSAHKKSTASVLSTLDADAQRFGKFKSRDEYDRHMRVHAEQLRRTEERKQSDPLSSLREMSTDELEQLLSKIETEERIEAQQRFDPHNTPDIFSEEYLLQNPAQRRRAESQQTENRKERRQAAENIKTVLSEKRFSENEAVIQKMPDKAISALDDIVTAWDRLEVSGVRENGTAYSEQERAMKQIRQSTLKLQEYGYDNWEELADTYSRKKNAEEAEKQRIITQQQTEEHPHLSDIAAIGAQAVRGMSGVLDTVLVAAGQEIDVNDQYHAAGAYADTVRETRQQMIAEKYDDNPVTQYAARIAYNVVTGIADNGVRMGIGYATGGGAYASTVSGLLMGSQVMSQAIVEGKQKGYSDEKAVGMAMVQAAIEAATEKWSVERILKDHKSVLKQLRKSMVSEGSEEVISNVANYLADALANGDQNELNQAYEQYRRSGLSGRQALMKVFGDVAMENLESFLIGGLSGAAMGSVSAMAYDRNRTELGKAAVKAGVVDELLEDAEGRDDKELQRYVKKINKDKENPDARAVWNAALRLDELGFDTKKTVKKFMDGKALTKEEAKAVQNNPEVREALEEAGVETIERRAVEEGDVGYRALMDYADYYKDERTKKAFTESFKQGQNVDTYFEAFNAAYQRGAEGYDMDAVDAEIGGLYSDDFTREQAIQAWNAGYQEGNAAVSEPFARVQLEDNSPDVIRAAEFKTGVTLLNVQRDRLSAVLRTQLAVIQNFGKEKGLSFVVVDNTNGRYAAINGEHFRGTNKIVINLDAESGIIKKGKKEEEIPLLLRTAGHEVLHYLEIKSPEAAEKMRDLVVAHFEKTGEYESLAQKYVEQGYKTGIDWEMTADSLFDVMSDKAFLEKYAAEDTGTVRTLRDTISAFIRKINDALKKLTMSNPIHKQIYESLNNDKQTLEQLRRMFNEALDNLSNENGKTKAQRNSEADAGVRYSKKTDSSIKEQIETNRDLLNSMDPVAVINEYPRFNSGDDVRKWVVAQFKKIGFKVERQRFGSVVLDDKRVQNALRYFGTYEERVAFAAVPNVIKRGVFIDGHNNHKGRGYDTVTFAAPVVVNGVRGNMAVVVRIESKSKSYYKVHRIIMTDGSEFSFENKNRDIAERAPGNHNDSSLSPTANISTHSISQGKTESQEKLSDIRKSLKPASSISEESRRQMMENPHYQEFVVSLRTAKENIKPHTFEESVARRITREIVRKYNDGDKIKQVAKSEQVTKREKIAKIAEQYYDRIGDVLRYTLMGESDTAVEDAFWALSEIAADIVKNSEKKDTTAYDLYEPLRRYLRTTKLSLTSVQRQEMESKYDSYENFRRKNFGRVNYQDGGMTLDEVWGELHERWPEYFSVETQEAEMPERIMEVLNDIKPKVYGAESMSIDAEAMEIAMTIMARYTNDKTVKALYGKKGTVANLGAHLEQELIDLRKDYLSRYRDNIKKVEKEYKKTLLKVLTDRGVSPKNAEFQANAIIETIAKNMQESTSFEVAERRRKLVKQITQSRLALAKKMAANSAKKNVPDAFKNLVFGFLDSITERENSNKGTKEYKEAVRYLHKIEDYMRRYTSNGDDSLEDMYADGLDITKDLIDDLTKLRQNMEEVIETFEKGQHEQGKEGLILYQMKTSSLEDLNRVLVHMYNVVNKAGELHQNEMYKHVGQMSQDAVAELYSMREYRKIKGLEWAADFMKWKNVTPYYALLRFGDAGKAMFFELADGMDRFTDLFYDGVRKSAEICDPKKAKAWGKEIVHVKDKYGQDFDMYITQIMSLYALSRRESALRHLLVGGITVGEVGNKQQSRRHKLTAKTISEITSKLTQEQKQVADALVRYMSTECAKWGNAVSMKRHGIRLFTENYYIPMMVDKNSLSTVDTPHKGSGLFDLINRSWTKELNENAENPLYTLDIFDVFSQHVSEMALYSGMCLPVLDFMKWYNGKIDDTFHDDGWKGEMTDDQEQSSGQDGESAPDKRRDTTSVKEALKYAYGETAQNAVLQIIKDLNQRPETDRVKLKGVASRYKVAKVAANLNVALVQPTSYVRAAGVISPKYLMKAAASLKNGTTINAKRIIQDYRDMLEYCPIGRWKSMGFFDADVTRGVAETIKGDQTILDKLQEASMKPAEIMDNWTWGVLFRACQWKVYHEQGMAFGSDACKREAAKIFREVVYATQVVDSPLTRSTIMRSKGGLDQIFTAFMSEPTLSVNMLMHQVMEYSKDVRKGMTAKQAIKKNGGKIARAVGVYALTVVASSMVQGIMKAARDEDDERGWIKWLKWTLRSLPEEAIPLLKIPILKDIIAVIQSILTEDSFNTSNQYTGILSEAYEAGMIVWNKWLHDDDKYEQSRITLYGQVYKVLTFLSSASGLAINNAMRDVVAVWNSTIGAVYPDKKVRRYEQTTKDQLERFKDANASDVRTQVDKLLENKVQQRQKDFPHETPEASRKEARSGVKSSVTSTAKDIFKSGDAAKARAFMQSSGLYDSKEIQKNIEKWTKDSASG